MSSVSVVIAARNEPTLAQTVGSLCPELPENGEILIVDDDSREDFASAAAELDERVRVHRADKRLGVAAARNTGAALTTGEVLLFADAHVTAGPGWPALVDLLDDPAVGAAGPTLVDGATSAIGRGLRFCDGETNTEWLDMRGRLPYAVPLLPGFFIATRRQVFLEVGGFDSGMVGWGIEDIEFCIHLVNLGYRCLVLPDVEVVHAPLPGVTPDYYLEWDSALHNILRLGHVHFGARRLAELHDTYRDHEPFRDVIAAIGASDAERRRVAVQRSRRFDDEWFFGLCGLG